jgi:hypothetical protein
VGVGRSLANVYRRVRVLFLDSNCPGVRVPISFEIAVQLLCCDDADYCLQPASLPRRSDDIQRHDGSGEGATGLEVEEVEEASADVEGNEKRVKGIDFVSHIVRCIGQEEMQGDMGEVWKRAAAEVARHT